MLRLLRLIDTCLSSSCLFIAVGWGHWLTNFSIDLNLEWKVWMKTLILISSSSPLPPLPWAAIGEMSFVLGSCQRTAQGRDGELALGDRSCSWLCCTLPLRQGTLCSPLAEGTHGLFPEEVLKLMFVKLCWMKPQSANSAAYVIDAHRPYRISWMLYLVFPFDLTSSLRTPPTHEAVFSFPPGKRRGPWHWQRALMALSARESSTKNTRPVAHPAWTSSASCSYQQSMYLNQNCCAGVCRQRKRRQFPYSFSSFASCKRNSELK